MVFKLKLFLFFPPKPKSSISKHVFLMHVRYQDTLENDENTPKALNYQNSLEISCGRTFVLVPNQVLFPLGCTHYNAPFLRPKAYKARMGGVSPQCG